MTKIWILAVVLSVIMLVVGFSAGYGACRMRHGAPQVRHVRG